MSHFSVMVVTNGEPSDDDLHRTLLPWHEYECTGIDAYLEFEPIEDFAKEYAEEGEGRTEEEFAEYYYGNAKCVNGTWGRMTNPNAKWDWWVIGGRHSSMLIDTMGRLCDSCMVCNINFDAMTEQRRQRRIEAWMEAQECKQNGMNSQMIKLIYGIDEDATFESHVETDRGFATFAVVMNGQWYERGEMGWFAHVSGDKGGDWNTEFMNLLESIAPEQWITIVDCHI